MLVVCTEFRALKGLMAAADGGFSNFGEINLVKSVWVAERIAFVFDFLSDSSLISVYFTTSVAVWKKG
jgi:hypothetical protein